jgi:hypothetical protein
VRIQHTYELLSVAEGILVKIKKSTLITVCHDWMRRLQLGIEIQAKSTKWVKGLIQIPFIFIR